MFENLSQEQFEQILEVLILYKQLNNKKITSTTTTTTNTTTIFYL